MTEEAFLSALRERPDDDATRLIFADWLQEQGDEAARVKADYIRLDCKMAASARKAKHRGLNRSRRELAECLPAGWLAVVSKAPVELCTFRFECPMRWENLEPVDGHATRRFCGQCQKTVTYCETIEEARAEAGREGCVAVDARVVRSKGDLYPRLSMTVGIMD